MIHTWESDPSRPNPYEEIEEGERYDFTNVGRTHTFPIVVVSVNKLRQELAKEDEENTSLNKTSLHQTSPSAFIQQAFALMAQR